MEQVVQTVETKPVATVNAGGLWDFANQGLNAALATWGQVEEIKATRDAAGQDVIQARVVPELENGAAVVVDQPIVAQQAASNNFNVAGVAVNKNIIYATGGVLLALALYGRVK